MDLPGINIRMQHRLFRAEIRTIKDLWNADPWHVRKVWGGVQGERFWYSLHGYEIPSIPTQKRNIGHSRMLSPELRNLKNARVVARALILKAAKRLRRYGLASSAFNLSARPIGYPRFEIGAQFPHTAE